ncbi:hypothetical protein PIB30_071409 [Stylosanthes scabra]|uniref:Uncharacterized protein n=1 Tax=Stylosanthes scabra TaxID=79078 RepID=A0ABU6XP24_9FABA|nr:hypothetical protein [Stylosanthes scabra]
MGLRVACCGGKGKVQVQAWKVAKHVYVLRCSLSGWLSHPLRMFQRIRESQGLECKLGFYVFRVGLKLRGFCCVELSVCNVTISAERVRGALSHIGVLYLVSEQFFPFEPEGGNCYASEHNLNQGIMRGTLPEATIRVSKHDSLLLVLFECPLFEVFIVVPRPRV